MNKVRFQIFATLQRIARLVVTFLGLSFILIGSAQAQMLEHIPEYVKQRDSFLMAARLDDVKKIQAFIKQGVDPNLSEPNRGETALMLAVREDAYQVFAFLLTHPQVNLDARAANGDTALMLAAYLGKVDWVAELINAGAQVNQAGWTALHYAAAIGDEQIIAVLLEYHAYIDAESPNKTTPLMMAARKGNLPAVRLLVEEGADLSLKNMAGMTAVDFAREADMTVVTRFLEQRMTGKP